MTVNNLRELVKESHAQALKSGWWDGAGNKRLAATGASSKDIIAEKLALVHSELSEALECYRNGQVETFYVNKKPEGFWVEIADAAIRAADLAGWLGLEVVGMEEYPFPQPNMPVGVCALHLAVSDFFAYQHTKNIQAFFQSVFAFASFHEVDLWEIINLKMAYNATREYRHGGKRV